MSAPEEGSSVCFLDEDLWEEPEGPVRSSKNLEKVPVGIWIFSPNLQEAFGEVPKGTVPEASLPH